MTPDRVCSCGIAYDGGVTIARAHHGEAVELPPDGAGAHGAKPGAHAHGPHDPPPILVAALAALETGPKGPGENQAVDVEVMPLVPIGDHRLEENGNRSRFRKQDAQLPHQVEDDAEAVRDPRPGKLIVPEAKRCEALTTRGKRCKAPKLRGLRVCMFHGHLSSTDERLMALADESSKSPRLSPRRALRAVAEMRAGEMAVKAVDGALDRADSDGGRAVLALVDAVDPQVDTSASLVVTADNVDGLSFAELTLAVRSLIPSGDGMATGLDPL